MKTYTDFIVVVIFAMAMLIAYCLGNGDGYKQGQMDALNGKINIKIQKITTVETVWAPVQTP
jgi:hypothetical protein